LPELPLSAAWRPAADWPALRLRSRLLGQLRRFFEDRGFLEVETPLLSADVVVDRHLHPLAVTLPDNPRRPRDGRALWLQTSPEFAMKRLLAAGAGAIYQVTRAFRGGEIGRLHNPEFTLVEWYRPGDTLAAGMALLAELAAALLNSPPAEQLSYADAFARWVQVDPHRASPAELAAAAARAGLAVPESFPPHDRDAWLHLLLAECVEPHLGIRQPTILYGYPASQAALAQVDGHPPGVAQRFELYVAGVELANGYHELRDPAVLRARNAVANQQRRADGAPQLPADSRLLAAMDHGLPECTGAALGFDRLVMLAAGAHDLAAVLAFPIDRA
jgi:lysyl-tRNA synthetase class 2